MIKTYSVADSDWNNIVRSFSRYDVQYLSEYADALAEHDEGEPTLLYYEGSALRAINVIVVRDIAKISDFAGKIRGGAYFDVTTPYGYGGWLIENKMNTQLEKGRPEDIHSEDIRIFQKGYEAFCNDRGIICEFVRFNLFSNYIEHYDGFAEKHMRNVVRSLTMPIDEMWMDFKQKVRKNVKRANAYGLEFIADYNGEYLDDFLHIYYDTMDRAGAEKSYYFDRAFFERFLHMSENAMYFYVKHEEKIISSELVIFGSDNAYSFLGGTESEYFDMRPNDFLKFEIIKWLKERGLKNFVLGGGHAADDGIFKYKTQLAPHGITDFYMGCRIFDAEKYDELCAMRGVESHGEELGKAGFFPEYRQN